MPRFVDFFQTGIWYLQELGMGNIETRIVHIPEVEMGCSESIRNVSSTANDQSGRMLQKKKCICTVDIVDNYNQLIRIVSHTK